MKNGEKGQRRIKKGKEGLKRMKKDCGGLWGMGKDWMRKHLTMQSVFRFFVLGLLLQFFVHTMVTFERGWDAPWMKIIWMRKELLMVSLAGIGLWRLIQGDEKLWNIIREDRLFVWLALCVVGVINLSLLSTYVTGAGLKAWIYAAKYNIFPMVICLIGYVIGQLQGRDRVVKQLSRVARVLSWCLIFAFFWYIIVGLKPGALKYFGYDTRVYEGVVGQAPPAAYLSLYDKGNMRNQFLFERPIVWGFYLVMLFPLFFVQYLRRRSWSQTWLWWLLYAFGVIVTFSRAAWGAWLVLIVLVILVTYRRQMWKYMIGSIVGLGLIGLFLMHLFDGRILVRDYSDKGHLYALQDSITMIGDHPVWGHGPASAGPASHQMHEQGFNPENQFLQIVIEYGLIGFLPWMVFYILLLAQGLISCLDLPRRGTKLTYDRYVIALVTGLVGLCIEGLVLHSFADRMVIYPFMMMMGIVIGGKRVKKD